MNRVKVLHISRHQGCINNIKEVCDCLGCDLTTQVANWDCNMYPELAVELWNKYREYYSQFDVIITSDTAPLSRIFLQNNFKGKLIIWVCNRFDYADAATSRGFPDRGYYELFSIAASRKNIKIFSYTKFEHEYAEKYHGIKWGGSIIKPFSLIKETICSEYFNGTTEKKKVFFVPPYHNDTIFMDLKKNATNWV